MRTPLFLIGILVICMATPCPLILLSQDNESTTQSDEPIILVNDVDEFNEMYWTPELEEFCKKPQNYQGYYPIEKIAPVERAQTALPVILIARPFSCEQKTFSVSSKGAYKMPRQFDLRGLPLELRNKITGAMASSGVFPRIYMEEQINPPVGHPLIIYLSGSVSEISFREPCGNRLCGDQEDIPRNAHFKDVSANLILSLENHKGEAFWSKKIPLSTENYFETNDKKNTQTVFTRELDAALTEELYEQIEDILTEMKSGIRASLEVNGKEIPDIDIEEKDVVPVNIVTVFKLTNDKKNIDGGSMFKPIRHRSLWKNHDFKMTATRAFVMLDYTIDGMQDFHALFAVKNDEGKIKAEKLKKGVEKDKGYRFTGSKTVLLYPGKHTIVLGLRIRFMAKGAGGGIFDRVISATVMDGVMANQIKQEELSRWHSFGQYSEIEIDVIPGEPMTIEAVPIYYKKEMKKGLAEFKLVQVD